MKNRTAAKVISVIITAVMCMSLFCCGASAVELDTKGSITLHVADYVTAEPIPDMTFRLYFFASAHEKANGIGYEYVSPYDECNMVLGNLEDSYLSVHLSHYANTHSLPYTEKTTDAEGNATFTNLRAGLYLAVFSKSGNNYFVPSPFVILVPRFDEENLNWDFDVIARPKMISYSWIDAGGDETYISVEKLWKTDYDTPESVTVSLLKDYVEVERVVLDESNGWSYRWDKLSKMHSWTVVENEVPDGYTVSYEISENTVKIINTYTSDEPPETTRPSDDKETTKPDGGTTRPPEKPTEPTTKPDKLEQTGQLNWPVPVFSIAGMLIFSVGWMLFNSDKKEEEEV